MTERDKYVERLGGQPLVGSERWPGTTYREWLIGMGISSGLDASSAVYRADVAIGLLADEWHRRQIAEDKESLPI